MTKPQTPEEDAKLMAQVAQGEEQACRLLVQRHLSQIVGLAMRMTNNKSEAEDIAQEAFVRLWKQCDQWQAKAKISTWLYRVTHNLSIDAIRRRERQNITTNDLSDIEDTTTDQNEMLHQKDVKNQIDAAISSLPERQRTAITLVHHRDLSNKDAAQIMNVSIDALESLLARGRRSLRNVLQEKRQDLLGVNL